MDPGRAISHSPEYTSFRSNIALRRIVVEGDSDKYWNVYDGGPKTVKCPLICLPPASGTADVFFKQILGLGAKGYRVIAVGYPVYWSLNEWCEGFRKLLDFFHLDKVHIFGASLGGFLAQKFAEYTHRCPRVASIFLCNSFIDTSIFQYSDMSPFLWMLPATVLKRMLLGNFFLDKMEAKVADSVDFMVERVESLTQAELASRLTLNCSCSSVNFTMLQNIPVTIMEVFDECALSVSVREELKRCYPRAKLAYLKSGGNFPYLSRADEVNLHLQVHLRQFDETSERASEVSDYR